MVYKKDVTLATMTVQHKNARLYEYLYGALLDAEVRTETEKDMIAYRQRTVAYLDRLDDEACTEGQPDQGEILLTEIKLNAQLIQTVRQCQSALWERHGYGLPTVRCAAKWVFQDFPAMLSRTLTSRQPLTFLCKHILDNYTCSSDLVLADICSSLDSEPGSSTALPQPSADNSGSPKHDDHMGTSDGENNLNLDQNTSVDGVDMPTEPKSIRPPKTGTTNSKNDARAIEAERIVSYKINVVEALEKLQTTMSPDLDTDTEPVSLCSADMPPTKVTEKSVSKPVRYWPPFSKPSTVSTNTCSIDEFEATLEEISKLKASTSSRVNSQAECAKLEETPSDPEYGVSQCSVRASRMTPMRAPVKKGKKTVPGPDDGDVPDEAPNLNYKPYVKPWFQKRISHMTHALDDKVGAGGEDHWKVFHACLETVRQRVIERLKPKIVTNTPDSVAEMSKQKKRNKKTKRRRKCRKHTLTKQSISSTDSDHSIVQTSNCDVPTVHHVTHTDDVTTAENEGCFEKPHSAKSVQHRKDKKLRRKKKCRRKAKEGASISQDQTHYTITLEPSQAPSAVVISSQ